MAINRAPIASDPLLTTTVNIAPETKSSTALDPRDNRTDYKNALKIVALTILGTGVIVPPISAGALCAAEETCGEWLGPLNQVLHFQICGSAGYIVGNALYSSEKAAEAWDFLKKLSYRERIAIGTFILSLCAQEFILTKFGTDEGSWPLTAVATLGASPGAVFSYMNLKKINLREEWEKFKWKHLLGSCFKRVSTPEEKEMQVYAAFQKDFEQILKANFSSLSSKKGTPQFPKEFFNQNDLIKCLLTQKAAFTPEYACTGKLRSVVKYGLGGGAAGLTLTPSFLNTFFKLCDWTSDWSAYRYGLPVLWFILSAYMGTKSIYAVFKYFLSTSESVFNAFQNIFTGKPIEWTAGRAHKKLTLLVALGSAWVSFFSYTTQFALYKNNLEDKKTHEDKIGLRDYTLACSVLAHFIIAMHCYDSLMNQYVLDGEDKILNNLLNEIQKIKGMNFKDLKAHLDSLLKDETVLSYFESLNLDSFSSIKTIKASQDLKASKESSGSPRLNATQPCDEDSKNSAPPSPLLRAHVRVECGNPEESNNSKESLGSPRRNVAQPRDDDSKVTAKSELPSPLLPVATKKTSWGSSIYNFFCCSSKTRPAQNDIKEIIIHATTNTLARKLLLSSINGD